MTQVPPTPPVVEQKNNTLAIVSLVLGILSVIGCLCVAGLPAVICGHMARKQIAQGQGGGAGLAKVGLILGYIGIALTLVAVLLALLVPGLAIFLRPKGGMEY